MKKILALILVLSVAALMITGCGKKTEEAEVAEEVISEEVIEEPVVPADPFYEKVMSKDRPIAVMIDNDADYKGPQAGLENAFMIYEVVVEGGNTRMMALYKESFFDEETPADRRIGPVRSSRHYFLDFAIENDAVYAHCGWSPRAQAEISSRGVNNINGLYESAPFFRNSEYNNTWHNLYTDYKRLDAAADTHDYRRETSVKYNYLKNYTVPEGGAAASSITIPYSQCNIKYQYNEETGLYDRIRRGSAHTMQSGVSLQVMNVIILEMTNVNLNDGEGKGRQDLYNTGTGKGKYITGGKVIDITWEKSNREAKAKYLYNGNEITLNPGLTFVQIVNPSLGVVIE